MTENVTRGRARFLEKWPREEKIECPKGPELTGYGMAGYIGYRIVTG